MGIAHQADSIDALGKDKAALVGHANNFMHRSQGSDSVQIVGFRRIQSRVQLRRYDDGALFAQRLDQLDGAFAAHGQGQNGMGKENGIAHGQDGNSAHAGGGLPGWTKGEAGWKVGLALSVLLSTFLH